MFLGGEDDMAKAFWSSRGLTRGKAFLGRHGGKRATVKQAVHDGDTVSIEADGNISIRFLGIDTPEKSYKYPGKETFHNIYPSFVEYLTDPFSDVYDDSQKLLDALGPELVAHLRERLGPDCAKNHHEHAEAAHRELEGYIERDLGSVDPPEEFRFFLAFSYEKMDRYGRLLCWLHQDLPKDKRAGRTSYNEEMLSSGKAEPYFIVPNINPFRMKPLMESIPEPDKFKACVQEEDPSLPEARRSVRDAREKRIGIFDEKNPLMLEPFELRFLARREAPFRRVIDMNAEDPVLLKPNNYHLIPNPEDRLFVNPEHVPLFKERNYTIEA